MAPTVNAFFAVPGELVANNTAHSKQQENRDQAVENDLAAGALLGQRTLGANTYLDLTVGSVRGKRRVLVLMH